MSLFKKARQNLENKKRAEEDEEINEEIQENKLNEEIKVNNLTFERCLVMDQLKEKNDLSLLPLQCLLNHYILKCGYVCYYICVENENECDAFEIYEFEYTGEGEEEYRLFEQRISGAEYLQFLVDKIKDGFDIFTQKN